MERQHTQDQEMVADVEYIDALVERLVEHYLARTPLASKEVKPLTITLFHHLYCHIMAEGYKR